MAVSTILLIILAILILALIGGVISIYNGLITVSNDVRKAWKNIDVALQHETTSSPS